MEYDDLELLRRADPAWRLLRADNAPLVLSFLHKVFVEDNARSIGANELVSRLDDELYALNERLGETAFPKQARAYLDDWAAPASGWLRKYYPSSSDEAHYDATPAVEKALAWVESLRKRSFVGTESRLNTVFELLRQMAYGAETDPDVRLGELRRRRAQLDAEIRRVDAGDFAVLDASSQRDRYQQLATTARELLADFREVEANFRVLDRDLRARIAAWAGSKGELLDQVVGNRNTISDSDQGRSFRAFYDFLLSYERQAELNELLEKVQALDVIGEPDQRIRYIHHDWLDAAERTQATVRLLSEQLRRFLDDQVWLENRRVMDLLHSIESAALTLRDHRDPPIVCELDGTAPTIVLPMERPLYSAKEKVPLDSENIVLAGEEVDAAALFEQVYVDRERLAEAVRHALRGSGQIGLAEVLRGQPLELGLAELIGYLSLDDSAFAVVFDDSAHERVTWTDPAGTRRVATIPRVTFRDTTGG